MIIHELATNLLTPEQEDKQWWFLWYFDILSNLAHHRTIKELETRVNNGESIQSITCSLRIYKVPIPDIA